MHATSWPLRRPSTDLPRRHPKDLSEGVGPLRIVAFYFPREAEARDALSLIEPQLTRPSESVNVAPLVVDEVEGTILALTIDDGHLTEMLDLAGEHGGRLVANVPEEWTRARTG